MEEAAVIWAQSSIDAAIEQLQDDAIYDDVRRYLEQVSKDLNTHIKHLMENENV